jgi:hypothetical protein
MSSQRRQDERKQYEADLAAAVRRDLTPLSDEARAKVYLLTDIGVEWDSATRQINAFFPEGPIFHLGRERLLELIDGRNVWVDCLGSQAEDVLLWRLATLAPTLLPSADWPHVRQQLERRAYARPGMPVLVSRLLPSAQPGAFDDPGTREGYLRKALARSSDGERRRLIAAELARANLSGQWPYLMSRFDVDPSINREDRMGVLDALAEAPHSVEKLTALVAFLDDARNESLLAPQSNGNAESRPWRSAVDAVNSFRSGDELAVLQLQRDVESPEGRGGIVALRRLAHFRLAYARAALQ